MSKDNKVTLSIRLKQSVASEVVKLAHEQNRNVSNTIETILLDYLKKQLDE